MATKTWTLCDVDQDIYVDNIALSPASVGGRTGRFSITKRTLRGGLREGVDVVEIDNGTLRFAVVPTRGMGIWNAWQGPIHLGWKSPARGPVHPAFVHSNEASGLGWLDGFDELLVRCGLESNGAPEFKPDGSLRYALHGKIANLPAHRVEVAVDDESKTLSVTGVVDEARLFGNKLRLTSTVSTRVGSSEMTIRDVVTNISAQTAELQLLYHINVGMPLVGAGAKVVVPIAKMSPRDPAGVANFGQWDTYSEGTANFKEAVFYFDPAAKSDGQTHVMLHNATADQGVSLKYNKQQLPCFSLWKNMQAEADGYVTGLEPATNFPNTKSFEKSQGRVVMIDPGQSRTFEMSLETHPNAASVAAAKQAIGELQRGTTPQILPKQDPAWSPY